jgi:hypothetical protein
VKAVRIAPELPLSRKTFDLHKILNIRKILLPLDGRNGTHRVSKVREDKASRPALDVEEVTVSPSTSVKA